MERPIEYWKEMYLFHAQTNGFQKRVARSIEEIRNFHHYVCTVLRNEYQDQDKAFRVMWSGGKDSTALLHLVSNVLGPENTYAASEKDTMDFPGELEYLETVKNKIGCHLDIISPDIDPWEALKDENIDFTDDIHSRGIKFSDDFFYRLIYDYKRQNNVSAVFLGLRAEESTARHLNYATKGFSYYSNRDKEFVCQPIAHWSAKDVFAYLFLHDIPIFDIYFKTAFVESPEQIRKSWVLPSARAASGMAAFLKHYYPDIFNKLVVIMPKLKQYI